MGEFYDPIAMKRHSSPTSRLIAQKNTTVEHKKVLGGVRNTVSYGLSYTTYPGKSFIIEPKQELPYHMVTKDPIAFYDKVMHDDVVQHKVRKSVVESTVKHREQGIIIEDA